MFIWLKNSTLGISNSEDFHYLHWRLVADYPGHMTTYFRTQCQSPFHPKDPICYIWHSIKIKNLYTKPQSPTLPSYFCTKLWSKTKVHRLPAYWEEYYEAGSQTLSRDPSRWLQHTCSYQELLSNPQTVSAVWSIILLIHTVAFLKESRKIP